MSGVVETKIRVPVKVTLDGNRKLGVIGFVESVELTVGVDPLGGDLLDEVALDATFSVVGIVAPLWEVKDDISVGTILKTSTTFASKDRESVRPEDTGFFVVRSISTERGLAAEDRGHPDVAPIAGLIPVWDSTNPSTFVDDGLLEFVEEGTMPGKELGDHVDLVSSLGMGPDEIFPAGGDSSAVPKSGLEGGA